MNAAGHKNAAEAALAASDNAIPGSTLEAGFLTKALVHATLATIPDEAPAPGRPAQPPVVVGFLR